MLTIINQKYVMSDNFICFFEILDGVLHKKCKLEISRKISTYALSGFRPSPVANRSIPNIPFSWNSMENDDYCSEIHNGRSSIFNMEKNNILNVNVYCCFGLFKAFHGDSHSVH